MARQARKKSESGIYHTMLRGINQQNIFEDSADYRFFLQAVQECKEFCNVELYAYCLMGNHVHLLIKTLDDGLDSFFRRLAGKYVYWYNVKYQRVGHLFQDRYKSEPVDSDAYFLTVLRYIHQNPVKAGISKTVDRYPYSSYSEYILGGDLIDSSFALGMMELDEFIQYNNTPNDDCCMEMADRPRRAVTDDQAKQLIKQIAHCDTITQFQNMDDNWKITYSKKLYEKGISIRQLSRLTGVPKGLIERWIK